MKPFDKNEMGELIAAIHSLGKDKVRELALLMWQRIHELDAANSPETPDGWVSCNKRIPNKGQCVSVTDGNLVGVWRYRGWWPDFDGNGCASTSDPLILIKNITHWMPLPAAPKPEK